MRDLLRSKVYAAIVVARKCAREVGIRHETDFIVAVVIAQWALSRKSDPWLNQDMLVSLSELPRTTVQRSLQRLYGLGLLRTQRRGTSRLYTLDHEARITRKIAECVNARVLPILDCDLTGCEAA